jgi:F420-non-reducing hydrogenase small subunit
VVKVDAFLPGCPPHPDLIHAAVVAVLEGKRPDVGEKVRFG